MTQCISHAQEKLLYGVRSAIALECYKRDMTQKERPPIAINIRKRRRALGMSVAQLADKIDSDENTIYTWEQGTRNPNKINRDKLAIALQCSEAELMGVEKSIITASDGIQIKGTIAENGEVSWEDGGFVTPFLRHPNADSALVVRGHHNWPNLTDGDVVFYRQYDYVPASCAGLNCIVGTVSGKSMVCLVKEATMKGYRLQSLNGSNLSEEELRWASPILIVEMRKHEPLDARPQ